MTSASHGTETGSEAGVDRLQATIAAAADAAAQHADSMGSDEQKQAAQMIQRNYRGYRERRQLQGMGLDASARWAEVGDVPKWRNATRPKPRAEEAALRKDLATPEQRERATSIAAREKWKRAGEIARRAGADDPHDASPTDDEDAPEDQTEQRRKQSEGRAERERTAKMMDLQYFLEMVDQKHRYGSNLRAYHEQWKKADTHENFFYWLDCGEGRHFEHPTVSRERLDTERVRYLSREERLNYLVTIDKEGRLCWAKNGNRVNTTVEYKDSVNGIVPVDDDTPAYGPKAKLHAGQSQTIRRSSLISVSSGSSISESDAEAEHYTNQDLDKAKGISKLKHVSAATILNHLLRSSVKPNSWIFVADTSFRLYVGIKQSGAFQHSSFLHGARISAAGLIKVKDGQLRRLSPLSGHYRPPTKNFRAFVHSMKENGVDMSRVSISRSYAVLVGLEAYVKTRKKFKHGVEHVKEAEEKMVHPEEHERKVEEQKDKSESAKKERQLLAQEADRQEAERKQTSFSRRIWKRLSRGAGEKDELTAKEREGAKQKRKKWLSKSGEDIEDGIAPEGHRDAMGKAEAAPAS
ncbi:iq calmodulin-binding motif protein [Stemphylium lycopersici]|nr:iq calmodulin-binding motif protein [Stemphylium lycopersici]